MTYWALFQGDVAARDGECEHDPCNNSVVPSLYAVLYMTPLLCIMYELAYVLVYSTLCRSTHLFRCRRSTAVPGRASDPPIMSSMFKGTNEYVLTN
jgi:hypothetical protein